MYPWPLASRTGCRKLLLLLSNLLSCLLSCCCRACKGTHTGRTVLSWGPGTDYSQLSPAGVLADSLNLPSALLGTSYLQSWARQWACGFMTSPFYPSDSELRSPAPPRQFSEIGLLNTMQIQPLLTPLYFHSECSHHLLFASVARCLYPPWMH